MLDVRCQQTLRASALGTRVPTTTQRPCPLQRRSLAPPSLNESGGHSQPVGIEPQVPRAWLSRPVRASAAQDGKATRRAGPKPEIQRSETTLTEQTCSRKELNEQD